MDHEVVTAILSTEAEGEQDLIKSLESKNLDPKSIEAAVANYRFQKGTKDLVDVETFKSVAAAADYTIVEKIEVKVEVPAEPAPKADPVKPEMSEEVQKSFDRVNKELADARDKSAKADAALASEVSLRKSKEFTDRAGEEYSHLGKAEEVGKVLKSLHDLDGDVAGEVESLLKGAEEQIAKSELFGERGTSRSAPADAEGQLEALAKEIVAKAGGKLTDAQGYSEALKARPDLYPTEVQ